MTYLDRISECNNRDLSRYVPLLIDERQQGWIRRDRMAELSAHPGVFLLGDDAVRLAADLTSFEERSQAMAEVVRDLHARGSLRSLVHELYPVKTGFSDSPVMHLERAAVPYFGVRAWGIHVNGFVRDGDEIHMWIARRARNKATYPGMLDNVVAGGQPSGLTLSNNLIKECAEEAGIPEVLAATARPVGSVAYCHETDIGVKPDCMFCYDLELPATFRPRPVDGEVEEFYLWPIDRVAESVRESRRFKFNCNLVIIDFLIRLGRLTPSDPEFADVVRRLGKEER